MMERQILGAGNNYNIDLFGIYNCDRNVNYTADFELIIRIILDKPIIINDKKIVLKKKKYTNPDLEEFRYILTNVLNWDEDIICGIMTNLATQMVDLNLGSLFDKIRINVQLANQNIPINELLNLINGACKIKYNSMDRDELISCIYDTIMRGFDIMTSRFLESM